MGDRGPERPRLGSLGIDMNPLVIARRLGKQVNLPLGDLVPLARTKMGANGTA
jgi:hypothetical protein